MGKPKINLKDKVFGKLTVLEYNNDGTWNCLCECGNKVNVKTSSLNSGKTKSCGCLRGKNTIRNTRQSKPKKDLIGQTFGYLTPLYYIKGGKWHCKCRCGNEVDVDTRNLNSGHTLSCGCYIKEKNSKNNTKDMVDYENEYLKVLERAGSDSQGMALWKTLCKHCGNVFITRGSTIRNGETKSCGCVHSLNEQTIIKLLTDNNIEFSTQYTFPDLKGHNRALRFDFAIFKNGILHHLIEYNGKQHYEKSEGKWGEQFETLLENDKKKIQYCKNNNIELRIIRYDEKYSLKDLI